MSETCRWKRTLGIALLAAFLGGCGADEDGPASAEEVALGFYSDWKEGDFKGACERLLEPGIRCEESLEKDIAPAEVEALDSDEGSETATVTVDLGVGSSETVELEEFDGEWRITSAAKPG
jgi:hypothetical protein